MNYFLNVYYYKHDIDANFYVLSDKFNIVLVEIMHINGSLIV